MAELTVTFTYEELKALAKKKAGEVGIPSAVLDTRAIYATASYDFCRGATFTLEDLEETELDSVTVTFKLGGA